MSHSFNLPQSPWDALAPAREVAQRCHGEVIDLSIGTPADPTPQFIQDAMAAAGNAHTYPRVWGTAELRQTIIDWLRHRCAAVALPHEGIMPVVGTKELVAWLPTLLGVGSGDAVVIPRCAYPTYQVGVLMTPATVVRADSPDQIPADLAERVRLVWVNSPANPHGAVLSANELASWVSFVRAHDAVLASDECYLEFSFDAPAISALHPQVCGGSAERVLSVHSLSKRSNMAGYRAGFVAGDPQLVQELVAVRKHLGMIVPAPIQAAMMAALRDDDHVAQQLDRYRSRRDKLAEALRVAGYQIDESAGSLYLWVTRGEDSRRTMMRFAELGILVAPGDCYGELGARHVRVALTATDDHIDQAVARLTSAVVGE